MAREKNRVGPGFEAGKYGENGAVKVERAFLEAAFAKTQEQSKGIDSMASTRNNVQSGILAEANNTFVFGSLRRLWPSKNGVLFCFAYLLAMCGGLVLGCAPVDSKVSSHAALSEKTMKHGDGSWCGTSSLLEITSIENAREIVLMQVKIALSVAEALTDPTLTDAERRDVVKTLKIVVKDLQALGVSLKSERPSRKPYPDVNE